MKKEPAELSLEDKIKVLNTSINLFRMGFVFGGVNAEIIRSYEETLQQMAQMEEEEKPPTPPRRPNTPIYGRIALSS